MKKTNKIFDEILNLWVLNIFNRNLKKVNEINDMFNKFRLMLYLKNKFLILS